MPHWLSEVWVHSEWFQALIALQHRLQGEDVSTEEGKKYDKREWIIGRESSVLSVRRAISSPSALMHSLSNYHSTLWYSGSFIFCRGKSRMAVWSQKSIVKEKRVPFSFLSIFIYESFCWRDLVSGTLRDQSQSPLCWKSWSVISLCTNLVTFWRRNVTHVEIRQMLHAVNITNRRAERFAGDFLKGTVHFYPTWNQTRILSLKVEQQFSCCFREMWDSGNIRTSHSGLRIHRMWDQRQFQTAGG